LEATYSRHNYRFGNLIVDIVNLHHIGGREWGRRQGGETEARVETETSVVV